MRGTEDVMKCYLAQRIHHYQLALLIQLTVDKHALAKGKNSF